MKNLKLIFIPMLFFLSHCKKENSPVNITLHDKPLSVIQSSVQGKWWLKRVEGGFAYKSHWPITNNPYVEIKLDRIVLGSDVGVTLDTLIVWRRDKSIFNDSTYLLSYRDYKRYAFPIVYVVDRIKSDSLILIDNASDPFYYYYKK